VEALIASFIRELLNLSHYLPSLLQSKFQCNVTGYRKIDIDIMGKVYHNQKLSILDNLCVDVILGLDFQTQHKSVTFNFGGQKLPIQVCGLAALNVDPPDLFANLSPDCKPIATKSRKYSTFDRQFIRNEVQQLLASWRAQVVVTSDDNHKKRLVIDYSQTINKITQLDAYPLPRIDEFVNEIAQYRVFSSIDLKSAYHQIPLNEKDKVSLHLKLMGAFINLNICHLVLQMG